MLLYRNCPIQIRKGGFPLVNVYQYNLEKRITHTDNTAGINLFAGKGENLTWVDFSNPTEAELKDLTDKFNFHHLAVEDCVHKHQRSKIDEYDKYVFLVLHALQYNQISAEIEIKELAVFFGQGFIVTFHWDEIKVLEDIQSLCANNEIFMEKGADFLLYQILDTIVDGYFPLLDRLDEKFSLIETKIFNKPDTENLNQLFKVKRELLHMRKILGPQREVYSALVRHEFPYIQDQNRLYFVDINDHLLRVFDFLDTYRDLISNASEAQLTVISNKMNEIMKTLTVIATIMLPLTVVTGIYGMNFKFIPELQYKYGYFVVLGVMAAITTGMIYYFRRKSWF